jgi:kynurenine formamidase
MSKTEFDVGGGCYVIDLTQEIYEGMSVFPMHQRTFVFKNITHEESLRRYGFMFSTNNLILNEHGPTHTDALYESDPNGTTIDKTDLSLCFGPAVCLDVSGVSPDGYIDSGALEKSLKHSGQQVRKGDIVLLYTGHYERAYGTEEWQTRYAGLDITGAEWLGSHGVVNIGIDAPAIDNPKDKHYSGHLICQKYRMLNTENLCNLEKITGKRFLYVGLPLKIRGGSGGPIRAIAVLAK